MEKLHELGLKSIKFDYYCLDSLKEASKGETESYYEALRKINQAEATGEENGVIFRKSDMLFYKGFFHFQLKSYEEALKQFIKSKTLKTVNNELKMLPTEKECEIEEEFFDNSVYTDK